MLLCRSPIHGTIQVDRIHRLRCHFFFVKQLATTALHSTRQ